MAVVKGQIIPAASFTQTPNSGILSGNVLSVPLTLNAAFANTGTTDNVDLLYAATLTFVASTAQNLDLTSLTDILGGAVNFARVRAIAIKMYSTTDGATLTVGGAASNPWAAVWGTTGTMIIQAATAANANGSFFLLTAPNTTGYVTSGTSKTLKLLPSAHAFNADIVIAGAVA